MSLFCMHLPLLLLIIPVVGTPFLLLLLTLMMPLTTYVVTSFFIDISTVIAKVKEKKYFMVEVCVFFDVFSIEFEDLP